MEPTHSPTAGCELTCRVRSPAGAREQMRSQRELRRLPNAARGHGTRTRRAQRERAQAARASARARVRHSEQVTRQKKIGVVLTPAICTCELPLRERTRALVQTSLAKLQSYVEKQALAVEASVSGRLRELEDSCVATLNKVERRLELVEEELAIVRACALCGCSERPCALIRGRSLQLRSTGRPTSRASTR